MASHITPHGIALLEHDIGAPLWRALVTIDNTFVVNLIAALFVSIVIGYVVKRYIFWYDIYKDPFAGEDDEDEIDRSILPPRAKALPIVAGLLYLVYPCFGGAVMELNPHIIGTLPIIISALIITTLNKRIPDDKRKDEDFDDRRLFSTRLIIAGAFAGMGAVESAYGIVAAPLLLVMAWPKFIRRNRSQAGVTFKWLCGFLAAAVIEPLLLPNAGWESLMAHGEDYLWPFGFVLLEIALIAMVKMIGETFWVRIALFGSVIAVGAWTVYSGNVIGECSASEKFVREALNRLGERKLIIGDGIFDDMLRLYAPEDVKVVGTRINADREYILWYVEKGERLTNKALILEGLHELDEFKRALKEDRLSIKREVVPSIWRTEEEKTNDADKFKAGLSAKKQPLMDRLKAIEAGFMGVSIQDRESRINEVRTEIRNGWLAGFHSLEMSETLLKLDRQLKDRASIESDAITALFFDRDDPAANAALGGLRLDEGKLELAQKYLERVVGNDDASAQAMNDYARLMIELKRYPEAEKWASKAVTLQPDSWVYRKFLVTALLELKRYDEAAHQLDEIERLADIEGNLETILQFLRASRRQVLEK